MNIDMSAVPALPAGAAFKPNWSADERDLRSAIEASAKRMNARSSESGGFSRALWEDVAATGLFGLPFCGEEGGLGASLSATMYVYEGLGQALDDTGVVFSACTHLCALGLPLVRFGTAQAREAHLPAVIDGSLIGAHAISEPQAGSAAFEMTTRAIESEAGWRLTGEKCFVSNAPFAGMFVVYARTDAQAGPLSGFTAFLVPADAPGLVIGAAAPKIGLDSSEFAALYLDDVFVPHSHVLGRPGLGFSILDYVMKREIVITFAAHLGQMSRRFERTRKHARSRVQSGARISTFQAVSHRLVDDYVKLETARMWLYRAGSELDGGEQASRAVSIAKLLCSEANLDIAVSALRLHGAAGYLAEAGLGRDLCDAAGGVIYSGSSEIQRNRIAATLGL